MNKTLTVVDIFAGAGGLSLGFEQAGFNVLFAVENDKYSAETYKSNRSTLDEAVLCENIENVDFKAQLKKQGKKPGEVDILIGGPPCQGFSTSNTKNRNMDNPLNHLFKEYIRAVKEIKPQWVLLENVEGIAKFESGTIVKRITTELKNNGYESNWKILNAADYGIPQIRKRFFLIGNNVGSKYVFPKPTHGLFDTTYVSVKDAISDLPHLKNGNNVDEVEYRYNINDCSDYQREMRKACKSNKCHNNLVTANSEIVVERYKHIPQGGNWKDIPNKLMKNYNNKINCHSGIYRRLDWNKPSIVISNFRKNMLIHPSQNRNISIREAARIQSFPDNYKICGPLSSQQQQVANCVPPLLAFNIVCKLKEYMT